MQCTEVLAREGPADSRGKPQDTTSGAHTEMSSAGERAPGVACPALHVPLPEAPSLPMNICCFWRP